MARAEFDIVTPLPVASTSKAVQKILQDHETMIRLSPLTYEHRSIEPPPSASAEELQFHWYDIKERIEYLPAGLWSGSVGFKTGFYFHEDGSLETHTYASLGLKMNIKWTVVESAGGTGTEDGTTGGISLKEEVEISCNALLLPFVKRTMMGAHGNIAKSLGEKAVVRSSPAQSEA